MTNIIQGSGGGKGGGGGHTAVEADDTLQSVQYARVLDVICEGEIEGLYTGDKRSIFLNDVPMAYNSTDPVSGNPIVVENFKAASVAWTVGTQSQAPLVGFEGGVETEIATGFGGAIVQSTPRTVIVSSPNITTVNINMNIPRLTETNTANGDINGSKVEYTIGLKKNTEGAFTLLNLGSAVGPALVFTSNTATTSVTSTGLYGTVNLSNNDTLAPIDSSIKIEYRVSPAGGWTTLVIKNIQVPPSIPTSEGGNEGYSQPFVLGEATFSYDVFNLTADLYDIRITTLAGTAGLVVTGNCYIPSTTISVIGKTTSKYDYSHAIKLEDVYGFPYSIKITRITADPSSAAIVNEIHCDSYTTIVSAILNYPNTALVGLSINAKEFSSIPTRAYDVKLMKVMVPTNYMAGTVRNYSRDKDTGTDTGTAQIWDGTFYKAWTDNPAWCFYDMITNNRYGLGEYIPSSMVSKSDLYTIARYCDAIDESTSLYAYNGVQYGGIPDGRGGVEPRFTCNLYLQDQAEAYRVLQNMASIFRGMLYWMAGSVVPVADKPEAVWAQFTNADVIDGAFAYQSSSDKARHTVALVTWNDPTESFKQKIEYVEDREGITRYGVNQTEIIAMGCTSQGQAHRLGRWALYSERMETEVVSFKTNSKGINILPGKIINTVDQFRAGVRHAGRIISSTSTSLTIDSPITISSIVTTVSIEMSDGTIVTRQLNNISGSTSVLTWVSALTTQPLNGATWLITDDDIEPETWRVLSIQEDEEDTYSISALSHNSQKFDYIEDDSTTIYAASTTIYKDLTKTDPITGGTISDSIYKLGNNIVATKMQVSWKPVRGA